MSRAIWDLVIEDMKGRDAKGVTTYGRRLTADPAGRDPLWDAYEEALDLAVYLRQEIERRKAEPVKPHYVPVSPPVGSPSFWGVGFDAELARTRAFGRCDVVEELNGRKDICCRALPCYRHPPKEPTP